MYSVVLMVAATSGGDMASFGNKGGGCSGYTMGCSGSCQGGGFLGLRDRDRNGCNGGGFLGHKDKGGCHGSGSGCHGTVAAGCTGTSHAPVVAHSSGCHGSGTGCHGSASMGCHGGNSCQGGGFLGMRSGGGLFKGKGRGCNGGCHGW